MKCERGVRQIALRRSRGIGKLGASSRRDYRLRISVLARRPRNSFPAAGRMVREGEAMPRPYKHAV
jgi:hypothetical protein